LRHNGVTEIGVLTEKEIKKERKNEVKDEEKKDINQH
jgi:hypothetical protein